MIINFLGDSITEGVGASDSSKNYVSLFASLTGYKVQNYGLSGTRFARQKRPSIPTSFDYDFLLRAPVMDPKADFVFVFGGTNDFGHGDAALGKMGDKDPYTFYGALSSLCELLLKMYGAQKLCFILPLPTYGENGTRGNGSKPEGSLPLKTYVDAEKKVLAFYGIAFLDLRPFFPVPEVAGPTELTVDGLHPNDKGHALLAHKIKEYLEKVLAKR
jgi:lysophospholipase L1-like esterase